MKRSTELLLLSVLAAACGRGPVAVEAPMVAADDAGASVALDAGRPSAVATKPPDVPFDRGDRFRGHYYCRQGRTELTLLIEDIGEDSGIEAIFEFDFPGNGIEPPAVGSYRMRGTYDARSKSLKLKGERWIDQPNGYVMVDLTGTVMGSGAISGRVNGPSCSSFTVSPDQRPRAP